MKCSFIIKKIIFLLSFFTLSNFAQAETLYVGLDKQYKLPSQAIRAAKDGDIILIDAGLYKSDYAVFSVNNLTLKSIGGYAHIRARKSIRNKKAIWVIRGDNVIVDGIKFTGAYVSDKNGAGIRMEGRKLTIKNSFFENNEINLLTSNDDWQELYITDSVFSTPRKHKFIPHNIYAGSIKYFSIKNSKIYKAHQGHNIKSRAKVTRIINNEIYDADDYGASYQIDISYGGDVYISGNIIKKGSRAENNSIIAYAAEGVNYEENKIVIENNHIYNEKRNAVFLLNKSYVEPKLKNNKFEGLPVKVSGSFSSRFAEVLKKKLKLALK